MADQEKKAGEGTPAIDVAAITKSVTEEVKKFLAQTYDPKFEELTKNVGVLADTIKNAPPAKAEGAQAGSGKDEKPEALTAEGVSKIVADAIAADRAAQTEAANKTAGRQKLIEKVAAEKLGGDKDLARFLTGDDEAALGRSADELAAKIKTFKPDFGGATKDGGTTPGGDGGAPKANPNLSPGTAAFANSIKLPA